MYGLCSARIISQQVKSGRPRSDLELLDVYPMAHPSTGKIKGLQPCDLCGEREMCRCRVGKDGPTRCDMLVMRIIINGHVRPRRHYPNTWNAIA